MCQNNPDVRQASYEASSFCINAEQLKFECIGKDSYGNDVTQVCKEDFPALMHEWWHYIQDIAMISGQNGFYLWLRDMARIQQYVVSSENPVHLPLPLDEYGEQMNKDRILFYDNLGGDDDDKGIQFTSTIEEEPLCKDIEISNNGGILSYKLCVIKIGGKMKRFGLYALQELNAFYLQKIAESYCPNTRFTIPADDSPAFPYHIGDRLFDYYQIDTDLKTKFLISYLCLDSINAPYSFIEVLRSYKGQVISYEKDRERIMNDIFKLSNPNQSKAAVEQWVKEYKEWTGEKGWAKPLKDAILWYCQTVYDFQSVKYKYGDDILALVVSRAVQGMCRLYGAFPAPLLKQGGVINGSQNDSLDISDETQKRYDSALAIWSCRRIYQMLICKEKKQFSKLSKCILYEKCTYKEKIGKQFECALSPLTIVNNMTKAQCPYALAEWVMGLWKKDIVLDIE